MSRRPKQLPPIDLRSWEQGGVWGMPKPGWEPPPQPDTEDEQTDTDGK